MKQSNHIDITSRSASPTDVLWVATPFSDGLKSLRHISKFSLDHCLINAK